MSCNAIYLDQSVKQCWHNYCVTITLYYIPFVSESCLDGTFIQLMTQKCRETWAHQKRPGEMKWVFHTWLRSTADRWRTSWGEEGGGEWRPLWGGLVFSRRLGSRSLECSQQALHALLDTGPHPASNRVCRRARQTRDTAGGPGIQTLLIPQLEPDIHTDIKRNL